MRINSTLRDTIEACVEEIIDDFKVSSEEAQRLLATALDSSVILEELYTQIYFLVNNELPE